MKKSEIQLVSMVVKCTLDQPLDFLKMQYRIERASPPWHSCIRIRVMPENYDVAIFKSGIIMITGIKSFETINSTVKKVNKRLKNLGIPNTIQKTEIVNIVCMGSLFLNSTLERIFFVLDGKKTSYEPEQFPGLIYKDWGTTFLLFSSGKMIMTGIRNFDAAEKSFEKMSLLISKI